MEDYKYLYTIDEQRKLDNDWILNKQLEEYYGITSQYSD